MTKYNEKIVHFDEYCSRCKYEELKEEEDPCYDCLAQPVNTNSHKPVYFVERDKTNGKNG